MNLGLLIGILSLVCGYCVTVTVSEGSDPEDKKKLATSYSPRYAGSLPTLTDPIIFCSSRNSNCRFNHFSAAALLPRLLSFLTRPHSIGRTSRRTPRVHGRTRPLFNGQTSLALPRVNRTDSHSESPRPLSHGRISPALGRPTPIQPFPNPDMDGINRHSTTTQPSFVSNPRTIPTQPSHIHDP